MLLDDAETGAAEQAGSLLWQGWRFWDAGCRLYALSDAVATRLLTAHYDVGPWRFAAPPACYVQLPYQRLWARVAENAAYEPVDGCFLAARTLVDGAHELSVLMVLGLRRERPGVSLTSHRALLRDEDVAARAARPWREGAEPFANAIPGGERMDYRALATTAELEALAVRTLHYLDTNPHALGAAAGSGRDDGTHLGYVTVE